MQYHYHLQGLIYRLIQGSRYHQIHDKEGFKFFCFSNIFPAKDLLKNDRRTLIISSPDRDFIDYMSQIFNRSWNRTVKVGAMNFDVESMQMLENKIPNNEKYTLITGTPIIVRANRNTYTNYGVKPRYDYEYVYWRTEYPVELFLRQLEMNLRKKFGDFHSFHQDKDFINVNQASEAEGGAEKPSIFQRAGFKKQISTKIIMKGTEQTIIATVWEFVFEGWENKELLQFALDAGLGERNSLGFGFMNLVENKDENGS